MHVEYTNNKVNLLKIKKLVIYRVGFFQATILNKKICHEIYNGSQKYLYT